MRVVNCEQGSDHWKEIKRGKISGTRLEQAFKQSDALMNELIAERMMTVIPDMGTSAAMEKGNMLEPFAKKMYALKTGTAGDEYGFILHPERDDIGISPDWVLPNCKKAVEIKCPAWKTHVSYIRDCQPPKDYIFQLLHYFVCIPELESIDFVSFDELNEVMPMSIKTFTLDQLLDFEYLKNKKVGSMSNLQDRLFEFADAVDAEYNRLVF